MRTLVLLLLAGACVGLGYDLRPRRGVEQDFWSGSSVNYYSGEPPAGVPFMDIPVYGGTSGDTDLDKIQVVSSSLKILPKNKVRGNRENVVRVKREPLEVQSWRRPRQHQFVTNTAERLPPPAIVRVYPPGDRDYDRFRGVRKSQRRIIYYANLPEIVRPPVQWYRGDYYANNRQNYISPSPSSYSPTAVYPSTSDNEITRVQSNIIDVTNPRYNSYSTNSKFSYSTPKFTIIDVDPPYNFRVPYTRQPPVRFDPYPPPNSVYDIRTPPYRDHSYYSQTYRPTSSLEPVKLQIPTSTDPPSSTANATEPPANTTRFLPDNLPVSLRALSKFVT